jgi:hypothetical protein
MTNDPHSWASPVLGRFLSQLLVAMVPKFSFQTGSHGDEVPLGIANWRLKARNLEAEPGKGTP